MLYGEEQLSSAESNPPPSPRNIVPESTGGAIVHVRERNDSY